MRQILFITGTRADFGKLKALMHAVDGHADYACRIFVTGMHTLKAYGKTQIEVQKEGFRDLFVFHNQHRGEPMETALANTIEGLSRYVHEDRPDLLVVHGDRLEALAGSIVGALNNIPVAHVEGGERSGTVDESIRHAVSKLSHLHLVANDEARGRLIQLGEAPRSIFVIGSPDIDVMLSDKLPSLDAVKRHYEIGFERYALLLYHSVTTALRTLRRDTEQLLAAIADSGYRYVVIHPNNDPGAEVILAAYEQLLVDRDRYRLFPSMKFESFLTLLKSAQFIVGNSSAGVREAPVYGVPAVNVGSRQHARHRGPSILDVAHDKAAILAAIRRAAEIEDRLPSDRHFGAGRSAERFIELLDSGELFDVSPQKTFNDVRVSEVGPDPGESRS
ncbi:MAG TPA: UDP-N-acetylglucosamine 2-epimerase, partial [Candidatus Polarisedimenticolaceae bacterium]|nr:UDP-N-acetylglucosamine 2-epimerase [Candidatus Polarisedimenticolaceae bacterium]